ncbi:hypothetical protein SCALIN_C28_0153 [Candidatus Scalindua japonica]|uniref:Uncharacterized protein n=2 Tax=Candidatus Scalindua japonica TaxID=1284222 RepID=A0A286U1K7_9BACT|nr:hypothetical protein SCALIN_C28_0153 [Candidatus Scalindua japonica]
MKETIIEEFVEKITYGNNKYSDRFFEIFSARGFLLERDSGTGIVRLSRESHIDDCEFLEVLQNINYKEIYKKPHFDSIDEAGEENVSQRQHAYFDAIDTQLFDINNIKYLHELFSHVIPIDEFRLNWIRDWYGKFNQFKGIVDLPKIRVYDLEPFIARFAKAISSIGISTWSSCEGHWGTTAYIIFDRKYHLVWFQTLLNKFIKKKLDLACNWKWLNNRGTINHPGADTLEMYLELQEIARLIYKYRDDLINIKKYIASLLTTEHKKMNKKNLLTVFEGFFDVAITVNQIDILTI